MKPPTKADLRRELEQQMEAFLREGGQVNNVERGISGRDSGDGPLKAPPLAEGEPPRGERTYVPEVVAAIEERKQSLGKGRQSATEKRKKPRKIIIYDDFGEPLRWQWEES